MPLPAAQALMDEVLSPQMGGFDDDDSLLAAEQKLTSNAKKVALMTLGTAAQKYMMKLGEQQEILMGIADIIMEEGVDRRDLHPHGAEARRVAR